MHCVAKKQKGAGIETLKMRHSDEGLQEQAVNKLLIGTLLFQTPHLELR